MWFSNHHLQYDFDLNNIYLGDLILKSSTYDDFVHFCYTACHW